MFQNDNPYHVSSNSVYKIKNRYRKKLFDQSSTIFVLLISVNFFVFCSTFTFSSIKFLLLYASFFALMSFAIWKFDRLRTKRFLMTVYRPSFELLVAILILFLFLPLAAFAFVADWQTPHEVVQGGSGLLFFLHLVAVIIPSVLVFLVVMTFEAVKDILQLMWCCCAGIFCLFNPPRDDFDDEPNREFEIVEENPMEL